MKKQTIRALLTLLIIITNYNNMGAQSNIQHLDAKEQGIVTIAAFTANGDQENLKTALNSGLDAGLTISEIKEVLVQLYAYCGFPRSLNGLNAFMTVLDKRKAKNIKDEPGRAASPVDQNANKYEQGKKTLETLTGKPQSGPLIGASAFAPTIDTFLKEHLFADIFNRDLLTFRQRELATITVLATLPGLGSQLQFHIGAGLHVGLTETQLREVFALLEKNIGKTQADAANAALNLVIPGK